MQNETQTNCKSCQEKLRGRSDKLFCSDYCRNVFNAEKNKVHNNYMRNVNNILKKNRRILEMIHNKYSGNIPREVLSSLGFNFLFFTNQWTIEREKTYYFCYEFGLFEIEANQFKVLSQSSAPALHPILLESGQF